MEFTLTLNCDPRKVQLQINFVGPGGNDIQGSKETHEWTVVGYYVSHLGENTPLKYYLPKPGWTPPLYGQVISQGEVIGTWCKNTPDSNVMCDDCNRIIRYGNGVCFYCEMVKKTGNLDRNGIDFVALDSVE